MSIPSTNWSHEIARQKLKRIESLVNAKTRQLDRRYNEGGFNLYKKVRINIKSIESSIDGLDSAYSALFNNFKNSKRQ